MAYELIETVEVGAGEAASIEFTSIPQDGTDLIMVVSARVSDSVDVSNFFLQVNSLSGIYDYQTLGNSQNTVFADYRTNRPSIVSSILPGTASFTSGNFSNQEIYISNYASTSHKSFSLNAVNQADFTNAGAYTQTALAKTTAPISSIQITTSGTNFVQYSTASLYKITAA